MPRAAGQSDFVPERPPEPDELLPLAAKTVLLPKVSLWTQVASSRSTKWVLIFVAVVLLALLVLTMVGPHIPAGE